jgi:VanZ family protein
VAPPAAGGVSNLNTRNLLFVFVATVLMVIYGSLYPFEYQAPPADGPGPLMALLGSWDERPSRGDFLSNIIFYIPIGFFGAMTALAARPTRRAGIKRMALVVIGAGCLSVTMECLQYYDQTRVPAATDFYADVIGAILGAFAGWEFGREIRWSFLKGIGANPVAAMLLMVWLGYRLYPYVPTSNIHKYWDAVKPLVLYPSATPYQIFRHTAIWIGVCLLIEKVARRGQALLTFAAFAGYILVASILIISVQLTVPQLAGMALAFGLWRLTLGLPGRATVAALTLAVYVTALRLEPFQFTAAAGHFTWYPFLSFMRGSLDIDIQSFFEKFFLYGTLIWLLVQAGMRLRPASLLVAALLFVTSRMEVYIPDRSAEITDAIMALFIGVVMAIIEAERKADTLTRRIKPAEPRANQPVRPIR